MPTFVAGRRRYVRRLLAMAPTMKGKVLRHCVEYLKAPVGHDLYSGTKKGRP